MCADNEDAIYTDRNTVRGEVDQPCPHCEQSLRSGQLAGEHY
eukprot:gene49604-10257_t